MARNSLASVNRRKFHIEERVLISLPWLPVMHCATAKSSIIWSPILYFNFKSFMDPNWSSLIRFQYILHDSGVLLSQSSNFYKLKRWDLISGGNQFCRKSELFGPPFCISILKVLWTQFLCHSLDFNAFCMIQEYFSQSFEISTN